MYTDALATLLRPELLARAVELAAQQLGASHGTTPPAAAARVAEGLFCPCLRCACGATDCDRCRMFEAVVEEIVAALGSGLPPVAVPALQPAGDLVCLSDALREGAAAALSLSCPAHPGAANTVLQQRSNAMHDCPHRPIDRELRERRRALAPEIERAFETFSQRVFAPGALDVRSKQLIAVAVAHVTQCPWCIRGHTKAALAAGATPEQLMEAIWVAAEMRAGAAWTHAAIALDAAAPTERVTTSQAEQKHSG